MPELPEVEHIRRTLAARISGLIVTGVRVNRDDVVQIPISKRRRSRALLKGGAIKRLSRHGKRMAIEVQDGRALEFGLGMTGQFLLEDVGGAPGGQAHRHVIWTLDDSDRGKVYRLVWRDPRRFGGLTPFETGQLMRQTWRGKYGPDALGIDPDAFHERLSATRRSVKTALLDQKILAGVGNIYADEALFRTGVHPESPGCSLTPRETKHLIEHIKEILRQAIEVGGSTIRDHQDPMDQPGAFQASHAVYGREAADCLVCGSTIRKMTLNGRGTHWCPKCQMLA